MHTAASITQFQFLLIFPQTAEFNVVSFSIFGLFLSETWNIGMIPFILLPEQMISTPDTDSDKKHITTLRHFSCFVDVHGLIREIGYRTNLSHAFVKLRLM